MQQENMGAQGDKAFELCLSKCIYDGTRPPPIGSSTERLEETPPRNEIVKGCKKTCAVSKEQLMTGKPKIKADVGAKLAETQE